jgi:hypothetical protein
VLALLIARNCDASDWQQALMLTVLPLVSGWSAAAAAVTRTRERRGWRPWTVGVTVALLVTALAEFAVIAVWGGGCGG